MHNINVVLIPPFQKTEQKHILLPHGWKMQFVHENAQYENAIIIGTNYFGGSGDQHATVIKNGKIVQAREWNESSYYPINDALHYFGLQTDNGKDEFDTINLGKYRSDEDISILLSFPEELKFENFENNVSESNKNYVTASIVSWIEQIIKENFKDKVVFLSNKNHSNWDDISEISIGGTSIKIFENVQVFEQYLNSPQQTENIVNGFYQCWINGEENNSIVNKARG